MADDTGNGRKANIGERTFERVNELVEGGMNRTEAFTKIAGETDAKAGTVAANFYRVARTRGQHGRRRRNAKQGRQQARSARRQQPQAVEQNGNGNLSELADRLVQTANEVADAMRDASNMSEDMHARIERAEAALRG